MTVAFTLGAIVGALTVWLATERETTRLRKRIAFRDHRIKLLEAQLRHPSVRVLRNEAS